MNPPYAFALTLAQPLAQAVETLRAALAAEQMGIVSEVDMQATLKAKLGIDSAPQRLLGVCSPKVAHALVTAEPDIAALLPCGASVLEATPGQTRVLLQDPRAILAASASQDPVIKAVLEEARVAVLRVVAALGGQAD